MRVETLVFITIFGRVSVKMLGLVCFHRHIVVDGLTYFD